MFMSVQRSLRRSFRPHFRGSAFCGATALASGAALALGAPACSDKASDAASADTFEGGSGEASAATAATSDCTTCTVQECTGAWAVCLTDTRCVALRGCDDAFGESEGARDECFCHQTTAAADASETDADGGTSPVAAYAAFAACTDARTCGKCAMDCTSACTGGAPNKPLTIPSCGTANDAGAASTAGDASDDAGDASDAGDDAGDAGDAGVPLPVTASVDACASCVADKCGDAKKLCALGTECSVFLGCANACADTTCVDGCGTAHSTGKASAIELSSCTLTSCRSACGL